MVRQHVEAFRLLQRGSNTGKVVLRLSIPNATQQAVGIQAVTGGTGGLGLVTARWLGEQGASTILLVSRSGKCTDIGARSDLEGCCNDVQVERCDSSQVRDIQRLFSMACHGRERGVWHVAGLLADGMLAAQSSASIIKVFGAKTHGGWWMQRVYSTVQPIP